MCAYVDFVENPVSQLCRNSDTSSTVEGGVEGKEKKSGMGKRAAVSWWIRESNGLERVFRV